MAGDRRRQHQAASAGVVLVEAKSGVSTFDLLDFLMALVHLAAHRYASENPSQAAYNHLSLKAAAMGAVAVGGPSDAVPPYEAAKQYQSVDVIGSGGTAVQTDPRAAAQRSMDAMTVSELKTQLKRRGMSSLGTRRELITRLQKSGAL
ncbi:hypothetical protein TSOC_013895 [Tetrabaena socialis]|uniref:SAP domain-containing protein n=2 Tax=Tetrabaena socialis TaxID=47790 RepID=A0A2J7ZJ44_9CHLO|nr:hypothetical protein TSOC_013895 [Tetrabaena socialis]|eukprot:PNH00292.1 hypothetical protein TSOC_013895 [Tetrabaena socialis]